MVPGVPPRIGFHRLPLRGTRADASPRTSILRPPLPQRGARRKPSNGGAERNPGLPHPTTPRPNGANGDHAYPIPCALSGLVFISGPCSRGDAPGCRRTPRWGSFSLPGRRTLFPGAEHRKTVAHIPVSCGFSSESDARPGRGDRSRNDIYGSVAAAGLTPSLTRNPAPTRWATFCRCSAPRPRDGPLPALRVFASSLKSMPASLGPTRWKSSLSRHACGREVPPAQHPP